MMKRQYKYVLFVIIGEILILSILKEYNVEIQSWIGHAIGTFVVLLPIQILLFLASEDDRLSKGSRKCFRILFWYIIICYILGGIVTLVNI
jgi:hypothetical protein